MYCVCAFYRSPLLTVCLNLYFIEHCSSMLIVCKTQGFHLELLSWYHRPALAPFQFQSASYKGAVCVCAYLCFLMRTSDMHAFMHLFLFVCTYTLMCTNKSILLVAVGSPCPQAGWSVLNQTCHLNMQLQMADP